MINGHSVVPGICRFISFVLGVKKGSAQEIRVNVWNLHIYGC